MLLLERAAPFPNTRDQSLFDLSTRKACHATDVTVSTVGSYPAFSPFLIPTSRDE